MSSVAETKQLPAGWKNLAIEEIAEVNPRLNKAEISDDLSVSFVPMPAVEAETGVIDVTQERPFAEVKKGFTPFMEGDVLFAKITPCMENGKMAVVPKVKNNYGFGSTEFHVLRPKAGIDARYLYYFVSSKGFRNVAQHNMTGAVGQKRVPTNYLKQQLIPIAPLDQQKRIVAKIEELFSHIDAGVEGLKKTQRLLKQYRQSVLKAAVTGELTKEWREENRDKLESATELLSKILDARREKQKGKYKEPKMPAMFVSLNCPEDWVIASVDQVADVSLGKMLDKSKHTAGNRLPYLRNINVRWGSVDTDDLSEMFFKDSELERYGVENGDVLVCEGGEPGRAAVWTGSHANMKYQKALHRVRFHVPLIPQYLVYLLEYFASTGLLERYFTGSTIKHFTRESFVSMPFPLPSLIEMKKIVELVEEKMFSMNRLKREIDLQLARAERNKQSVLATAFSGCFFTEKVKCNEY